MENLKKERGTLKGKFTRKTKLLEELLQADNPYEVLKELMDEISDIFKKLEVANDSLLDQLNIRPSEYDAEIRGAEEYIYAIEKKKTELYVKVVNMKAKGSMIKVKSLPHPDFSGDLRKFGTFTNEYERFMEPTYGKDPYALVKCLSGEALKCVQGVEDNFDSMMIRLKTAYGNPCKVTDSIVQDIKGLEIIPEGDTQKLINSINVIERGWLDMSKLKLEKELNTTSMVTLVESILPKKLFHDWVKLSERLVDKSSLFKNLLDFLLEEKRICEYMNCDIRINHRLNSHNFQCDSNGNADMGVTLQEIKSAQDHQNVVISECLNNVSKLMAGASNNVNYNHVPKYMSNNNNVNYSNYSNSPKHMSGMAYNNLNNPNYSTNDTWNKKSCWLHQGANHTIFDCTVFKQMSNSDKLLALRNYNVCFKCIQVGHISRFCRQFFNANCDIVVNGSKCGFGHNRFLHNALYRPNVNFNSNNVPLQNNLLSRSGYMLMVSTVKCKFSTITVLWDGGSDVSLITHDKAKELGLVGKDINISITKVGNVVENIASKEYIVPIVDLAGNVYKINCCGMDKITKPVKYIDISVTSTIFSCLSVKQITRPFGDIHMLIGIDNCFLLPNVIETRDNLQLMENPFGYVLRGSHPSIVANESSSSFSVRIKHITVNDINEISCSYTSVKDELKNLFSIENMGVSCEPKCGSCRCGKCISGSQICTLKEERELLLIKEGLFYDHVDQKWSCKYPWIKDPYLLPNNYSLASAMLNSLEKRLIKSGKESCDAYQNEMRSNIERGVFRKLSIEDMKNYKDPVFYIPHTEVLKPESESTPLRIVFNSSIKYCGFSLNEMWAKGPDVLNSLFGILLRIREFPVAFTCDLSKMYNQVALSVFDMHCHRILWRDFDQNRKPDHYVLTCATFGDKCAGIIAMLALKSTAEMFTDEFPKAANIILENSYVDDIIGGSEDTQSACKIMNEIDLIVSKGSFKIKHFLMSGNHPKNPNVNIAKTVEGKILGVSWKLQSDHYVVRAKVNFSSKRRNIHKEPDLTIHNFNVEFPSILTRRMVFSVMAAQYDPLGLISPFLLKGKILMRKLVTDDPGSDHDWDNPLSSEMKNEWYIYFQSMFELDSIKFLRCVKPSDAVGSPILIIFSDASFMAYGACAYIRYELKDGSFISSLLTAKCKIAPVKSLTIPRLELNGAVLSARLETNIVKEMKCKFERVYHIVDSAIVRAQIQKESYGFGTFTSTRIAEIQNRSNPEDWWWVSGNLNPADLVTRSAKAVDLNENSVWQRGPNFLTLPVTSWPIRKDSVNDLPDKINIYSTSAETCDIPLLSKVIDLQRFSCYYKMIRVTCRVLKAVKNKSFRKIFDRPNVNDIKTAELIWIKDIQLCYKSNWKTRFCRLGPTLDENGIVLVGQRMANWLKNNYNQNSYILLPAEELFTKLFVNSVHNTCHAGIETLLAKIQIKYWIPKVRNLLRSIQAKCVTCRKLRKETAGQIMGQLPEERLKPSPAFANTALDLFGPFFIKDSVKKRTKCKSYGVIFNCLSSRSVHLDLIDGYSTKSFMDGFRRFISIRGCPKRIYSDCGSQLTSFNKELKDMVSELKIEEIQDCARKYGGEIEWTFTAAHAQWQNGVSEALIKSVKKSLILSIGDSILTFSQLQSTLFEIANILNQRPIGIKPGNDIELGKYLCPNDLLLGRTTGNAPSYNTNDAPSYESILDFNDQIVSAFWKKWTRDFWPSLIVRQKWHFEKRNLRTGDIVIFQDTNALKSFWKMGEIVIANKSKDEKVRNVSIRYKPRKDGPHYKGHNDIIVSRSAHRIVVILPVEERELGNEFQDIKEGSELL